MITGDLIANCINKGYNITTDQQLFDIDTAYQLLVNESYWARGMPEDVFTRAVKNSLCFGIYQLNAMVGFARVITDKATFAYLCDVFISQEHRGIGLSKWLVNTIIEHPELQGLRRWSLATHDAHGLYEQFGFTPITTPERWMQIYTPYITQ